MYQYDGAGHGDVRHFEYKDRADPEAHMSIRCGNCGDQVGAAVIASAPEHATGFPWVHWLRCPTCHLGMVVNQRRYQYPNVVPGSQLQGLPKAVADAYSEARQAAGANCYTSCELMCRKILMYVAVDKGEPAGKPFVQYLTALENLGYITPPMKKWVDMIRQHGNHATHELPTPDRSRAEMTLSFTEQLLRMVYEMEYLANSFTAPAASAPVSGQGGIPPVSGGTFP
ncbi:hypothetical protein GCM10010404_81070 [Nonomuraea africana]|uniref:DUF4145 domain-containing protein n=1 Tax=Nonomuraea africana TaxID=46171 RepID=A0ABR9KWY4_9ACTN|nr:DUF4145 domain-containing protein [Nonomuraea africana]MBE1566515.1 hypothetical protein [Nonomuraea africana]